MKKTSKFGLILALVLAFTFGSVITISAKPIDTGENYFAIDTNNGQWLSDANTYWAFYMYDGFVEEIDYLYVYGWNENTMTLITSQSFDIPFDSKINFNRGIATFTSSVINITVQFETDDTNFYTYGSRREGYYGSNFYGLGTITGTMLIDGVTYSLDGTFSSNNPVSIRSSHIIEK